MPPLYPTGFVWLCSKCHAVPDINGNDLNLKEHFANDQAKVTEPVGTTDLITATPDEMSPKYWDRNNQYAGTICGKNVSIAQKEKVCDFDDPKISFGFIKRGRCNKGKNFTYLHPPLCRRSNGNRMFYSREKCKFYHLKGSELVSEGKNYKRQENPRSDGITNNDCNSFRLKKKKSLPAVDCDFIPLQKDTGL